MAMFALPLRTRMMLVLLVMTTITVPKGVVNTRRFFCTEALYMPLLVWSSQQSYEAETIIISISWTRTLKHREVKPFAQSRTACKQLSWAV